MHTETQVSAIDFEMGLIPQGIKLVSIASFAKADVNDGDIWGSTTGRMRNWTFFTETATRSSLASTLLTKRPRSTAPNYPGRVIPVSLFVCSPPVHIFFMFLNIVNRMDKPTLAFECRLWVVRPADHVTKWSGSATDKMREANKTCSASALFVQEEMNKKKRDQTIAN